MNKTLFTRSLSIANLKKGTIQKSMLWTIGKIGIVVLLIIGAYILGRQMATSSQESLIAVAKPYYSKTINKDFSFPVRDTKGDTVATITYTIQSVELQNQIILQGQKADAVAGRTFLIINLKILNPSTQNIQLNTRDFIRVSIANTSELLAPEIHNDPVTIQPISTKYTRLGLPIDASVTDIKLHVGEINGQKTTIDVPLKK